MSAACGTCHCRTLTSAALATSSPLTASGGMAAPIAGPGGPTPPTSPVAIAPVGAPSSIAGTSFALRAGSRRPAEMELLFHSWQHTALVFNQYRTNVQILEQTNARECVSVGRARG